MEEDNSRDDHSGMNLDLNEEPRENPFGAAFGLGSLLNTLESPQGGIEDRIRYLEAVTARARHRQRWRQLRNSIEIGSFSVGPTTVRADDVGGLVDRNTRGVVAERNTESWVGCKRNSSHLVAKALQMDSEVEEKRHGDGGSFFDCNICLFIAREPILTCCGHLFCWACFYKLPYSDSTTKECPICRGEVTDSTIVPIYGKGDDPRESNSESSVGIPPRPKAERVESIRQQHAVRGGFHIPVTEVLRRIRTSIGAISDEPPQGEAGIVDIHSGTNSQEPPIGEASGIRERRRLRARQFSRVLSESAASLSSISSALNSAERNAGVTQAEQLTSHEGISLLAPASSSSRTNNVSDNFEQMENQRTGSVSELHLPPPSSSSSSRRRSSPRVSNMQNGASHETRRRRFG